MNFAKLHFNRIMFLQSFHDLTLFLKFCLLWVGSLKNNILKCLLFWQAKYYWLTFGTIPLKEWFSFQRVVTGTGKMQRDLAKGWQWWWQGRGWIKLCLAAALQRALLFVDSKERILALLCYLHLWYKVALIPGWTHSHKQIGPKRWREMEVTMEMGIVMFLLN